MRTSGKTSQKWARHAVNNSEAELRSEGSAQIVMRAAVQEVDLIAGFGPDADETGKEFEVGCGINRECDGPVVKPTVSVKPASIFWLFTLKLSNPALPMAKS